MRFCTHIQEGQVGLMRQTCPGGLKVKLHSFFISLWKLPKRYEKTVQFHYALETAMTGEAKKTTKSTDIKETRKAWKGKKL